MVIIPMWLCSYRKHEKMKGTQLGGGCDTRSVCDIKSVRFRYAAETKNAKDCWYLQMLGQD